LLIVERASNREHFNSVSCQVRLGGFARQKESKMLNVAVHNLAELTIFRCTGRLAFGHSDTLLNAISRWPSPRVAVLDLAGVTKIDAAGIGTLVSVRKHAEASGVALKLMNLTPRVEDLLELTRLRSSFATCAVSDMIGLLCCAIKESQFVSVNAAENYDRALDYSEPALTRSA
jgi:anti-anti-sigma factor